jgi:nitrilase
MGRKIRVAAAQLAPVFLDREATVEKVCRTIREAGRNGAQVVAFPETFIPGYPYWAMALDPLSVRRSSKPSLPRRLFEQSVEVPSQPTRLLCNAAKEAGCVAVIGLNEREGGTLYNTQLFVGATGELLGKHRKLVPTSHERMVWGRGDGKDLSVFSSPFGKLGGLICYEHSNALFRYALQAQGEEIHVANWPGGLPWINGIIDAAIRHYAFEGQAFVINSTAILTEEIIKALGEGGSTDQLRPGGGYSAIVAPGGKFLAGPEQDEETILYADLDFDQIIDWKMVVDSSGHYARPDVVRLLLRREPRHPLVIEKPERPGNLSR